MAFEIQRVGYTAEDDAWTVIDDDDPGAEFDDTAWGLYWRGADGLAQHVDDFRTREQAIAVGAALKADPFAFIAIEPCECCEEPVCILHGAHYAECPCPGTVVMDEAYAVEEDDAV